MLKPVTTSLLALLVSSALACTTTGGTGPRYDGDRVIVVDGAEITVDEAAQRVLEQAESAQAAGDAAGAQQLYRRLLAEYPGSRHAPAAAVAIAKAHLDAGRPGEAQAVLERALTDHPTSDRADEARYLLARAQLAQGDVGAAAPTLEKLVEQGPEDTKVERLLSLGRELVASGQAGTGVRYLSRALERMPQGEARDQVERELVDAMDSGVPFAEVQQLAVTEAKPGTLLDELVTFKLARIHLHLRDYAEASRKADEYLKAYPSGRFAAMAKQMREQLSARVTVEPKTVGVILPLSGDYKSYGQRALTAIKLGLGFRVDDAPRLEDEQPTLDPATGLPVEQQKAEPKGRKPTGRDEVLVAPSGIRLVVKDSRGDPDRAAQAVRELVEKDHVVAIIGDLLLDTALPAALAAEEYTVPMLSLSRKDGVAEAGPWSFRLALTARKQAAALARFAMDGLGMKRFGVMYPRHPYGLELMNAFWDEIDKRQGEVTAVESYAYDQTTFTSEAKALVGRSNPQSRAEYATCVADARAIGNDYQRRKAMEKCTDAVSPIVDFEALLIPDGFRTVSYIVPALVAEDVLLTKDRRTIEAYRKTTGNNHVRPVQLLGPNMWNDPELGKRLGKSIEGAVFVDGFDVRDGTKRVQAFADGFAAAHRSRPALIEAQAYDAAAIYAAILSGEAGGAPQTREQFRAQLASVKDFPGVTGLVRFDEEGDSQTPPRFFQVEGGELQRADPDQLAKGNQG